MDQKMTNRSEADLMMIWVEVTGGDGRSRLEARWFDRAAAPVVQQAVQQTAQPAHTPSHAA